MKKVFILPEVCVGCGLCEVYCGTAHSKYPNEIIKAFKHSSHRPIPRIIVERNEIISYGLACRQCSEPMCLSSCITGAIYKDNLTGYILINEKKCVSCSTCVIACPYGLIKTTSINQENIIVKCDMCIEITTIPICVNKCPNRALEYREEVI